MSQSSKTSAWLHWYFSSVPVQSLVSLTRETRFRSSPPPSLERIVRKQALWVFEKLNCAKWASHWPEDTSCHQMLKEWWQTIWRQQGEEGSRKRVLGLGLSSSFPFLPVSMTPWHGAFTCWLVSVVAAHLSQLLLKQCCVTNHPSIQGLKTTAFLLLIRESVGPLGSTAPGCSSSADSSNSSLSSDQWDLAFPWQQMAET